jgi:uncharacterized membrane protein YgdD (TMEM256/DUF423 family)
LVVAKVSAPKVQINLPCEEASTTFHQTVRLYMRKLFLRTASILGFFAVAIGAFAAHGLKPHLSAEQQVTFETGVKYHFVHTLALLAVAIMLHFSGSLYLLSTRSLHGLSVEWLGPITPVGGLFFLAGWGALFLSSYRSYDRSKNAGD